MGGREQDEVTMSHSTDPTVINELGSQPVCYTDTHDSRAPPAVTGAVWFGPVKKSNGYEELISCFGLVYPDESPAL